MRRILAFTAFLGLLLTACEKAPLPSQGKPEGSSHPKVVVEREKEEKVQPPPPEVKIKLRRDGKDNYSWELSSSDVDQLLKVNEKLRKGLGEERQR